MRRSHRCSPALTRSAWSTTRPPPRGPAVPVINPTPQTTPGGAGDITGPCADWPVTWTCDLDTLNPAVTGIAVSMATETLWALTGMRFGVCQVTLRPCARDCQTGSFYDDFGPPWASGSYPQPALIGGLWYNLTCWSCAGDCSCTEVSEVRLPAPVNTIVEVLIDGTPMVSGAYRIDNNRLLVRTDGAGRARRARPAIGRNGGGG